MAQELIGTGPTLTINPFPPEKDGYSYYCVVRNSNGSAQSETCKVNVVPSTPTPAVRDETGVLWGTDFSDSDTSLRDRILGTDGSFYTPTSPKINLYTPHRSWTPEWVGSSQGYGCHFPGQAGHSGQTQPYFTSGKGRDWTKADPVNTNSQLSVEVWLNSDTSQGTENTHAFITGQTNSVNYRTWSLGQVGNNFAVRVYADVEGVRPGTSFVGTTNAVTIGQDQHVVATFDVPSPGNGICKIYSNGQLAETINLNDPLIDEINWRTGKENPDTGQWENDWAFNIAGELFGVNYWQGYLYKLRIYGTVISESQIENNYRAGK